jgi:hypothetical protein
LAKLKEKKKKEEKRGGTSTPKNLAERDENERRQ